jgi:hypothetical protein
VKKEEPTLHAYSVNYRKRGDRDALIDRGFWIHNLPRIVPTCRLRGHKPVVDGTEGTEWRQGYRWVCCDRCGLRTRPQMELDPDRWSIGDPYPDVPAGAWPAARGTLGGQLQLGRGWSASFAVHMEVGYGGSDDTLAGHISLGPLGALYLHTEDFGTGLQRRLNPVGYQSRVTELGVADALLYWRVWAPGDGWSQGTPRWRHGFTSVGVRDRLLGPVRFSYEVRAQTSGTVRMPDGDDHPVTLKLERQIRRRKRGRATLSWRADWSCRTGIPEGFDRSISASSVAVSDAAVDENRWAQEACAAIAADISAQRTRRGWAPPAAPMADADQ